MSNSVERGMESFFRKHLSKDRENPLAKISLRHAAPGSKGHDVDSFEIPPTIDDDCMQLVSEVLSRAQEDADGQGGQQRYVLHIYEKGSSKASARFMFRLRGAEDEYDESGGEESPTMKGLLQQLMRHNEATMRTSTIGMNGVMSHLVRRLESSDQMVERLMRQRQEMFIAHEAAMSTQHDRDTQLLMLEGSEKRKDEMFAKISLLMPVLVNKLAGKKVFDADDPVVMALKGFVGSLTKEQFQGILGNLKPEQQVSLMTMMQTLQPPKKIASTSEE